MSALARTSGRELILGVTGSIAAYKAVYLLRELTRRGRRGHGGHSPRTPSSSSAPHLPHALRPAGAHRSLRSPERGGGRARRARRAGRTPSSWRPATANLLAKAAHGIADDFLTTLLLAARCPVLIAPAMDGGMWDHPAVTANVRHAARARGDGGRARRRRARLRPARPRPAARGRRLVEALRARSRPPVTWPASACWSPPGRRASPSIPCATSPIARRAAWATRWPPRPCGGAPQVILVSGPTALTPPRDGDVRAGADGGGHARGGAAPRGHGHGRHQGGRGGRLPRPASGRAEDQVGKRGLTLDLTPNPDILAELAARATGAFIVGFAAETNDVRGQRAGPSCEAKGMDLLVANDVSRRGHRIRRRGQRGDR